MPQKQILVIEDDPISQNMLRSTLTGAGYSTIIASDGEEGLRKAKETPVDLVILDIMLPGMDGGEVAGRLRSDPQTAKTPIVFLSSLISEDEEKTNTRKDLTSFLAKPYNLEKLLDEIGRYLRTEDLSQ
jgi:CheY-like chemotaxis protein